MAQRVKNPPAMQEIQEAQVQTLSREDPLEEEMTTHSIILPWKSLWTEGPRGLQYSPWCRKESDVTEQLSTHTR